MMARHLNQAQLAERWNLSPRTLEQWRWQGKGPRYLKIGNRINYPLAEAEAVEAASLHANTVGPFGSRTEDDRTGDGR
jgi:hypothetical protein